MAEKYTKQDVIDYINEEIPDIKKQTRIREITDQRIYIGALLSIKFKVTHEEIGELLNRNYSVISHYKKILPGFLKDPLFKFNIRHLLVKFPLSLEEMIIVETPKLRKNTIKVQLNINSLDKLKIDAFLNSKSVSSDFIEKQSYRNKVLFIIKELLN